MRITAAYREILQEQKIKKIFFFLIDFLRSPALIYLISTSKKRIFTVKKSSQKEKFTYASGRGDRWIAFFYKLDMRVLRRRNNYEQPWFDLWWGLQAAKKLFWRSSFFSNLGRALFFCKKYKEAKYFLNQSLKLNSHNYEAHLIFFYLTTYPIN